MIKSINVLGLDIIRCSVGCSRAVTRRLVQVDDGLQQAEGRSREDGEVGLGADQGLVFVSTATLCLNSRFLYIGIKT